MKRLFHQGTVFHDPALDSRVVHGPPLLHQFFDMPIAQGIGHIPAYTNSLSMKICDRTTAAMSEAFDEP